MIIVLRALRTTMIVILRMTARLVTAVMIMTVPADTDSDVHDSIHDTDGNEIGDNTVGYLA